MARHSTAEDLSAPQVRDAKKSRGATASIASPAEISEAHLPPIAAGADLLAILVRAHVLRGDAKGALRAAERLSTLLPARPDPVDLVVDAALDRGRTRLVRGVLQLVGPNLPGPQAAVIKARLARAEGDLPAARAILVVAIERDPMHAGLRVLLTEMMVAAGTASDARAVLTHLGQAPVNPVEPGQTLDPDASAEVVATPGAEAWAGAAVSTTATTTPTPDSTRKLRPRTTRSG